MAMLRRRLFGEDKNEGGPKAEDKTASQNARGDDASLFMKEEDTHEDLANQLLRLTSAMKQNFAVAGSVLKDDNMTLTAMQSLAEANRSNLEREGKRLEHHASKSCFEWTMLLTVVLIIWSFIAMIIVMKVFPKRV